MRGEVGEHVGEPDREAIGVVERGGGQVFAHREVGDRVAHVPAGRRRGRRPSVVVDPGDDRVEVGFLGGQIVEQARVVDHRRNVHSP